MTARRQERLDDVLTYIGLGLVFLFFGLPLLWVLSLAFRNAQEILVSTVNPIPDNPTLDYMAFPRLVGIAEIGWSPAGVRSWDGYRRRLAAQGPRWDVLGVSYFRSREVPWRTA